MQRQCPLSRVKRTSRCDRVMSACDPKRKSSIPFCCGEDRRSASRNVVSCCPRPDVPQAARAHQATRRLGCSLATYRAGAATRADAARRRADGVCGERSGGPDYFEVFSRRQDTSTASSKVRSLANYRCKRRQASSYLSILRPRRRLASPSRKLRSPSPT